MQHRCFAIFVSASPEQVWRALTDPLLNRRLYGGLSMESDWRPDSRITIRGPAPTMVVTGRVLEAEPNRHLTHSFVTAIDSDDPESWLSWEIEQREPGLCRVTVSHDDLEPRPDPEQDDAILLLLSTLKSECEVAARRAPA